MDGKRKGMSYVRDNRGLSFIIITAVYILAGITGFYTYNILSFDIWLNLLIADALATVVVYIFSIIFGNASVYDPYWSVQPIVILILFIIGKEINLTKALLVIAVSLWAIRLTANWAYTFSSLNHQDWRYTMLKINTGAFYPIINFIGIHMVPTVVVYFCILPAVYLVCSDISFKPLSLVCFAVSLAAIVLQGTADIQMHKYRKNRSSVFIEKGVWKHSRHPNYLAEILMWWAIAFYVLVHTGFMWYSLIGCIANTLLFLFVSIPLAEGKQSKKEGYAEYRSRTRSLLLIPKYKKNST